MLSFAEFILLEQEEKDYFHYSQSPNLTHLSGDKYGSGLRGAESKRLEQTNDPRIKKRVYFYPPTSSGDAPKPESGLGGHVYKAKLPGMFDATKINDKSISVSALSKKYEDEGEHPSNAFERSVLDHGFSGYHTGNMSVVLNKDVPVQYHGEASQFMSNPTATQVLKKPEPQSILNSSEDSSGEHSSSYLSGPQMEFFYKNKSALTNAAPSIRMQYGKMYVHSKDMNALKAELENHPNHPL